MPSFQDFVAPTSLVVVVLGGIFGGGWLKIIKETNVLLKEQNEELKVANKDLTEKHDQALKQLAQLQGQVDVLKSVPLTNIDTTLKSIAEFNKSLADSNNKILHRLEKSAVVLAENTKREVKAVKMVKEDLQ